MVIELYSFFELVGQDHTIFMLTYIPVISYFLVCIPTYKEALL